MIRFSPVGLSSTWLICVLLAIVVWLFATEARGDKIVFLQDGRTIRAEKTEVIGDRVRVEKPAETIELPRSAVLSIHRLSPPETSSSVPPPAEVYRGLTHQMTERVGREMQERPGVPAKR